MKQRYYISGGQNKLGPFSAEEIQSFICNCQLGLTDYVLDGKNNEWILATSIKVIESNKESGTETSHLKSNNQPSPGLLPQDLHANLNENTEVLLNYQVPNKVGPKAKVVSHNQVTVKNQRPSQKTVQTAKPEMADTNFFQIEFEKKLKSSLNVSTWIVRKQQKEYGPYNYATLVSLIMDGVYSETDFIKKNTDLQWIQINSSQEFSVNFLATIKDAKINSLVASGGFKRKQPRLDANIKTYYLRQGAIEWGVLGDISVGGCSLLLNMPRLAVGSDLLMSIHFALEAGNQDFKPNVLGQILNQRERVIQGHKYISYSLKFTKISSELLFEIESKLAISSNIKKQAS